MSEPVNKERFVIGSILNDGPVALAELKRAGLTDPMLVDPLARRVWRIAAKLEADRPGEWGGVDVYAVAEAQAPECLDDLGRAQTESGVVPSLLGVYVRDVIAEHGRRQALVMAGELVDCLKARQNPRALLGSLVDLYNGGTLAGAAAKEKPFKTVVGFSEFMAQELEIPPPIVEGFLLRTEVTLLSAEAKLGKTWALLQLAECVAAGRPFLGWRTEPGAVLYINMEVGAAMMQQRARMVAERLGVADPPVYFVNALDEPMPLTLQTLERRIKATVTALGLAGKVALVILDPLYVVLGGLDENSASDISGACLTFKRIGHDVNAAVVVAHHVGKGDPAGRRVNDRSRGSSAFSGSVDNPLSLTLKTEDAEGKVAQLAGRWRNLPGLPPHDLRFSSATGLWENLGEAEPMEAQGIGRGRPALYTVETLVEMFEGNTELFMRRQDFINKGIGKNVITSLLNTACETHRLVRTRSSSGDVYRLPLDGEEFGAG